MTTELTVRDVFDLQLREVSGICERAAGDGRPAALAIGDDSHHLLVGDLEPEVPASFARHDLEPLLAAAACGSPELAVGGVDTDETGRCSCSARSRARWSGNRPRGGCSTSSPSPWRTTGRAAGLGGRRERPREGAAAPQRPPVRGQGGEAAPAARVRPARRAGPGAPRRPADRRQRPLPHPGRADRHLPHAVVLGPGRGGAGAGRRPERRDRRPRRPRLPAQRRVPLHRLGSRTASPRERDGPSTASGTCSSASTSPRAWSSPPPGTCWWPPTTPSSARTCSCWTASVP